MVVTVMVVVAMTVLVRVFFVAGAPRAKPLPQDGGADEHHQQARHQREPRVELLGHDECREAERDEAESEHARCVRNRHRATEKKCVARSPLRPDEVRGDHRLAMAGRECVSRAPEGRDQERQEQHADGQLAALDQLLEAATDVQGRCNRSDRGRWRRTGSELDGRSRRRDRQG